MVTTLLASALIQDILRACATKLASTLFVEGFQRAYRKLRPPQQAALKKVYTRAFEAMLHDTARAMQQEQGEISEADLDIIGNVMTDFIKQSEVKDALLAIALGKTLDMDAMHRRLRSVLGPERLQNIHFEFERALGVFQDVLAFQMDQEAAQNKELFPLWTVGAIRAVQLERHEILALLQEQNATLERIEKKVDQLVPPPPQPKHPPRELGGLQRAQHFVSRTDQREQLLATLHPGTLITICGPGGMGKSALTAEVIHQLAPPDLPPERPSDRFPDGVIVYSFYGEGRGSPENAFQQILSNLGATLEGSSPADATRAALARKQLLLVLDGAEQADSGALSTVLAQRDPAHNAILITSRSRGDAPSGTTPIDLPPLPDDDAAGLLQELAPSLVDDPTADRTADRICQLVGYLPLAVTLVGDFLSTTGTAGQAYLQWLDQTPLDALNWEQRRERSVPLLLERSLAQVDETARAILGVVGMVAYAPLDPDVLGSALELSVGERIQALGQLVNYGLLVHPQEAPTAYTVAHALIHTYSRETLAPPAGVLDSLVTYVNDYVRANRDDNFLALDPLRPHVMALVATCQSRTRHADVLRLAWAMRDYLDLQGYWADRLTLCEAAIHAAGASDKGYDEMAWLSNLGNAYAALGQVERAIDYYEQALAISQEIGDRRGEGAHLGNLGIAYAALGQVERAIAYYEQALAISQEIGDRSGEGNALGNLGIAYRNLGQVERAIAYYEQALAISQEIGDRRGEGNALGNLGNAYYSLGQVERAIDNYEQALAISQEIGDRSGQGNHLGNLGIAYAALGQVERAIAYYEQALAISQEIGDRRGEGNALGNLGLAYAALGQVERAIAYYEQALAISQEIGDRSGEGNHLGNLGIAYRNLGQVERAIAYYEQALAISQEIGDRRGEGAHLGNLGLAYAALGQVERAIDNYEQALAISQEIGDRRGQGNHLANLGMAYKQQGDLDRAKSLWHSALQIFVEIKSPTAETVRGWLAASDED